MAATERICVAVAESSPVISAGLSVCLRRLPGLQVNPVEVKAYRDLLDCISTRRPDIVMINPDFGGVFDPARLRADLPGAEFRLVAVETGRLPAHVKALYDESVSVVDDLSTIAEKIRRLVSGPDEPATDDREPLSQREREIIALVAKGLTNKEIADTLFLSVHTVITHRRNIARKLEIHSATGLTIYAIVNHLVDLSDIHL